MNPVLSFRIIIPLLLVLSAAVASVVTLQYLSAHGGQKVARESIKDVRQFMGLLQSSTRLLLQIGDTEAVKIQLDALAKDGSVTLALLADDQGKVLIAAHDEQQGKEISELATFLSTQQYPYLYSLTSGDAFFLEDRNSIYAVYPVMLPDQDNEAGATRTGLLVVEKKLISHDKITLQSLVEGHVGMSLMLILPMSALLWLGFHFLITRRVNRLVEVTQKVADGDLSARSGFRGRDELGCLALSFDNMAINLAVNQHELRVSEERLRISQEYANIGTWELNIKTRDMLWSNTIRHIFGCAPEDVQTLSDFISYVHPDDRVELDQAIQHCIDSGEKYDHRHRIVRPDGAICWVHEQGDVVQDEDGIQWRMLGLIRDITEQKESEFRCRDMIRELNYQKRAMDQHSIVAVTNLSGQITYANDRFSEISGYSNDELLGKTHRIVNSGFHSRAFFAGMWRTIRNGEIWRGEVCNRKKCGDLYWLETTVVPHLDENGKPDRYIAIRTDITERVLTQQAIRDERGLLAVINDVQSQFLRDAEPSVGFENLLQAILSVTDSEYGFVGEVFYNADHEPYIKTVALSNIVRDAQTHASCEDYMTSGMEFHNLETLFGRALLTGQPVISNDPPNDPRSGGLPEGHPPLNSFLGVPLYMGQKLIGMAAMANRKGGYDEMLLTRMKPLFTTCSRIIDAYRAEKLRKHTEADLARFKSTLDRTLDCVFMFEPESLKCFYVNQGAMEQVGYSYDELMDMTIIDIKPEFDEAGFRRKIAPLIAGSECTATFETVHQHKDGHCFPVEVFLQYIAPSDEPPRFVAMVRDVSERQKLQQQLQQAQKMEAIGQLTGGIAHDFNNMLASIMGYTELAREGLARCKNEKTEGYLCEVYKSGVRARDLVAQMLAFSRGGEGEFEPLVLSPLVKESLKMLGNTLPSSIEMDLHLESDDMTVMTNPVQLHQLVMNLCINARDAMEGEGRISIGLQYLHGISTECGSCHEKVTGDYIQLSVSDTGCGIRPEQMNRLFDPFYTTKEVGKGTGMGLSMVHGIMHDHGGHILVKSEPGKGTAFALLFPVIEIQSGVPTREDKPSNEPLDQSLDGNILVVDDEASVGHFIGELLRIRGCHVTVETDSRLALSCFRNNPDAFDLLITDQTMPGMTGADLAMAVMEIRPELPVILCTGYSDRIDGARSRSMGIRGYIKKPIETDEFLTLLKALLQAEKTGSEAGEAMC